MTEYSSSELQDWLMSKAVEAATGQTKKNADQSEIQYSAKSTLTSARARRLLVGNDQRGRDTALIGRLYFYKYNPLWKEKLTYYDKFPMCIPIERYHNGFLGINLHYLSVGSRDVLLNYLSKYNNQTSLNKNTRFMIGYGLLEADDRIMVLAKPAIKRYLFTQIRSRFIQIYPYEFDKATQLPVEDWVFNT